MVSLCREAYIYSFFIDSKLKIATPSHVAITKSSEAPIQQPEVRGFELTNGFYRFFYTFIFLKILPQHTVNPNPVQLTAFPCKSIPTGKNLLSLQGNPVLIAGSLF